jgi:hypothetical protein
MMKKRLWKWLFSLLVLGFVVWVVHGVYQASNGGRVMDSGTAGSFADVPNLGPFMTGFESVTDIRYRLLRKHRYDQIQFLVKISEADIEDALRMHQRWAVWRDPNEGWSQQEKDEIEHTVEGLGAKLVWSVDNWLIRGSEGDTFFFRFVFYPVGGWLVGDAYLWRSAN